MVPNLKVMPQETCLLELPFPKLEDRGAEYYVNVYTIANKDYSLIKKGHVLAAEQFVLPCLDKLPAFAENGEVKVVENGNRVSVQGRDVMLEFDRETG